LIKWVVRRRRRRRSVMWLYKDEDEEEGRGVNRIIGLEIFELRD